MRTLTFLSLNVLGLASAALIPTTAVAATSPCGTDDQCNANTGNCPAGDGWIYLTEKTVRCCRPSAADTREYFLFDFHIKVYNKKAPGTNDRCYRLINYTPTGVRCYPQEACIAEPEPPVAD